MSDSPRTVTTHGSFDVDTLASLALLIGVFALVAGPMRGGGTTFTLTRRQDDDVMFRAAVGVAYNYERAD